MVTRPESCQGSDWILVCNARFLTGSWFIMHDSFVFIFKISGIDLASFLKTSNDIHNSRIHGTFSFLSYS